MQLLRAGLRPAGEADPGWKPLSEIAARLEGAPLEVPKSFREAFRRAVAQVPGLSGLDTPALGKAGVSIEPASAGGALRMDGRA